MSTNRKSSSPLDQWARNVQKRLRVGYESTLGLLNHPGDIGDVREAVVREILESILPKTIQIGTGQILDAEGGSSNQIDLVIARSNAPAFRLPGDKTAFFYETVLATIEIKSMLYKEKLVESLDNCLSVKQLLYGVNIRSKGWKIFKDAFEWVDKAGGIDRIDQAFFQPKFENTLDCPIEVWKVINWVFYWLHWTKGDLANPEFTQKAEDFIDADFDFFVDLLALILKEDDRKRLFMDDIAKAEGIKEKFFVTLFRLLSSDELPPSTFVFAYGGYENLDSLINEVKTWNVTHESEAGWWMMPRVILNHKMFMHRTFNQYHCSEFEYPVLIFMSALVNVLSEDINFDTSLGLSTGLQAYFDLRWLQADHPKHSQTYKIWKMPINPFGRA